VRTVYCGIVYYLQGVCEIKNKFLNQYNFDPYIYFYFEGGSVIKRRKEEALDRTMWRNRFGGGFEPVVRQNTEFDVFSTVHHSIELFH
jgi:hypothetical protein